MWEEMLLTEQLSIHMDKSSHRLELKLREHECEDTVSAVQLSQAELTQLLHTLLEINRCFRGDIAYFHN